MHPTHLASPARTSKTRPGHFFLSGSVPVAMCVCGGHFCTPCKSLEGHLPLFEMISHRRQYCWYDLTYLPPSNAAKICGFSSCRFPLRTYGTDIFTVSSQNFTSAAVMEANGSVFTNKYSEGLPGARYYGGNDIVDQV